MRVAVTSNDGSPVQGAGIWLVGSRHDVVASGVTGASGLATLEVPGALRLLGAPGSAPPGALDLVVRHDDYASFALLLHAERLAGPEPIEVVLSRGGCLAGLVRTVAGRAVPGVRVVAMRSGSNPRSELLGEHPDPRMLVTTAGSGGMFRLCGLEPDKRYDLLAAGAGWVGDGMTHGVHVGTQDLDLRVQPVYGAWVVVRDETGAALATDRAYSAGGARPEELIPQGNATLLAPGSWVSRFAGSAAVEVEGTDGGTGSCSS
jgi:hypothetical protein